MSTESGSTKKEISDIAAKKKAQWEGYRDAAVEFPRLRDRARAARNIGSVLGGAVASYFGYALATGEAIATDSLLGLFTLAAIGVAAQGEKTIGVHG